MSNRIKSAVEISVLVLIIAISLFYLNYNETNLPNVKNSVSQSAAAVSSSAHPDGWEEFFFTSSVDGVRRPYTAYNMPSGSPADRSVKIVVFLGGAGGDAKENERWSLPSLFSAQDLAYVKKLNVVILIPEPRFVEKMQSTFFVESPGNPGESDILDCVAAAKKEIGSRRFTLVKSYMSGGSMGGIGALNIAGRHPEIFSGALSFSAPVDLAWVYNRLSELVAQNPGSDWTDIQADLAHVCGGTPTEAKAKKCYEDFSPINVLSNNWKYLGGMTFIVIHGLMDDLAYPSEFYRLVDLVAAKSGDSQGPKIIPVAIPEGRHDASTFTMIPLWGLIASEKKTSSQTHIPVPAPTRSPTPIPPSVSSECYVKFDKSKYAIGDKYNLTIGYKEPNTRRQLVEINGKNIYLFVTKDGKTFADIDSTKPFGKTKLSIIDTMSISTGLYKMYAVIKDVGSSAVKCTSPTISMTVSP